VVPAAAVRVHSSAAEWARRLSVLLVKRLVTPSPPRLVAIDVEQELWNFMALRVAESYSVPDCLIRALPGRDVLITAADQAQFLSEERLQLGKSFMRLNARVQPREVTTSHEETGK
jgi:hypothetical protein